MAKGSRGLPSHYSLRVPEVASRPVHLDDYLDETIRPAPAPARAAEPLPAQTLPAPTPQLRHAASVAPISPRADNVVSMPPFTDSYREALLLNSHGPSTVTAPVVDESRMNRAAPPRKQLNMSPDTLRMVEELLDLIKRYSGQKDAKASEMFHALVTALYESRELISLQNIPARGRWGTPTARAFPIALKNAFQAAMAELHRRRSGAGS